MFDLDKLYNKHIQNIEPYDPVDPTEQLIKSTGIKSEDVIRLNANENPYGPPPQILDKIKNSDLSIYPDSFQRKLRFALESYTGIDTSELKNTDDKPMNAILISLSTITYGLKISLLLLLTIFADINGKLAFSFNSKI